MNNPNPLHLANTAQQMARTAPESGLAFTRIAMVCMGVTALASAVQVLQPLLREHDRKHAGRGR